LTSIGIVDRSTAASSRNRQRRRHLLADTRYVDLDAVDDGCGEIQCIPVGDLGRPTGGDDRITYTGVAAELVHARLDDCAGHVDQHARCATGAAATGCGAGATTPVVVARGNDASVAGGGVRSSHTAPAHTTTVAADVAINRAMPNHSIQARARSAGERGGTGLDNGSIIDLPTRRTTRRINRREPVPWTLPPAPGHLRER
jgi:hypothetical protein